MYVKINLIIISVLFSFTFLFSQGMYYEFEDDTVVGEIPKQPGPGWYVDEPYEGYLPQTKRNAVNRHNGKSEKLPNHIWWNNHYSHKWVDINPETEEYELTRDIMGDEYDAYNFGYNELFTPWSNPSSYVNGDTDISLQLYNENGDNITVKVFTTFLNVLSLI